jgi:hypothetical protein
LKDHRQHGAPDLRRGGAEHQAGDGRQPIDIEEQRKSDCRHDRSLHRSYLPPANGISKEKKDLPNERFDS